MQYGRPTEEKLILIIDDSEDDIFLFKRLLARSGIVNRTHSITTGEEARAYLDGSGHYADRQKWPIPSIIILDLCLPGGNGFEFLQWCRAHHACKHSLIIVLSGSSEAPMSRRAYELGANSFLVKPARSADLEKLIHAHPQHWERKG